MTKILSLAILFCFLIFITSSCDVRKNETNEDDRIKKLTEAVSNDEFISLFLKFIKENNLNNYLVQYESELVEKKYLDGYDKQALNKYFQRIIGEEEDKRCVSASLSEKMAPLISKFKYDEYKNKIEQKEDNGSKEYRFMEYLKNGGFLWRESLEHALKDNEFTTEKRYFYLVTTMPFKRCD